MQTNLKKVNFFDIKFPIFKTENIHKTTHFGRTVIKAQDCFTTRIANLVNAEIDSLDTVGNNIKNNNIRRVVIDPTETSVFNIFSLKFDDNNEAENWSHLAEKCNQSDSAIYSLAKDNINYLAKAVGWKNETIQMSIMILRYPLNNKQEIIKNLPWHQDPSTITMTSLLTPAKSADSQAIGFTGGDLNFRAISKEYKKEYASLTFYHGKEYDLNTTQSFAYPENGGFIFDGITSFHKVSDIKLHNPENLSSANTERRLFSIFVYPDPEVVVDLSDKLANKNIVDKRL